MRGTGPAHATTSFPVLEPYASLILIPRFARPGTGAPRPALVAKERTRAGIPASGQSSYGRNDRARTRAPRP
ncbi:hypothetical protein SGPA1_21034 [Streptomyces misionensis JCM 4497]